MLPGSRLNSYDYRSLLSLCFFFFAYYDDTILFSLFCRFNTFVSSTYRITPPLRVLIDLVYAAF